jgi:hypothetical protein
MACFLVEGDRCWLWYRWSCVGKGYFLYDTRMANGMAIAPFCVTRARSHLKMDMGAIAPHKNHLAKTLIALHKQNTESQKDDSRYSRSSNPKQSSSFLNKR